VEIRKGAKGGRVRTKSKSSVGEGSKDRAHLCEG